MYRKSKSRVWSVSTQGFWFVPTPIVGITSLLSLVLLYFDSKIDSKMLPPWLVIGPSAADTALAMLSTIAGSMITAGATVFSITIVAMTLASMQFSPRVLGNFMHDRATQVVLGVFLGVFVYCLIVLRAIRTGAFAGFATLAFTRTLVVARVEVILRSGTNVQRRFGIWIHGFAEGLERFNSSNGNVAPRYIEVCAASALPTTCRYKWLLLAGVGGTPAYLNCIRC